MKEETVEGLVMKGLAGLVGASIGTLDTLTTGWPIVTIGLPIWEICKFLSCQESYKRIVGIESEIGTLEGLMRYAQGLIPYTIGAAIPFSIKYHNEIYTFIKNLIER